MMARRIWSWYGWGRPEWKRPDSFARSQASSRPGRSGVLQSRGMSSSLQNIYFRILQVRNGVDFPLRQIFRWRRPGLVFPNQPKDNLFAGMEESARSQAEEQARRLLQTYKLQALYSASTRDNYLENLYYLDLLEQALDRIGASLPPVIAAADIGPSHWFYVQALYALLQWRDCPAGRQVELSGFEADPYRVYADLRSRWDHAQTHMRGLQGVQLYPHGFRQQPRKFDLITMLFPFVFLEDHLKWGLPGALFDPDELLCRAWASLKPGGILVIVNQGEKEHLAQNRRLQQSGIQPLAAYEHHSLLYHYDIPRYVLAASRSA